MACDPKKARLLGRIGEELAPPLLEQAGFTDIQNLNAKKMNHEDADFLASRGGHRYFISVKARNKWTNKGEPDLNPRYKLHSKRRSIQDALETARSYQAEYAWLTIQVDRTTYSAYLGTHTQLLSPGPTGRKLNGKGVMMTDAYTRGYRALAEDEPHGYNYDLISNCSR
jgi:hypothetical protein